MTADTGGRTQVVELRTAYAERVMNGANDVLSVVLEPGASMTVLAVDQPAHVAVTAGSVSILDKVNAVHLPLGSTSTGRATTRRAISRMVSQLRAVGRSRVEVAQAIRERFNVNPRVALRMAHGWTQQQVADEWNRRWPDDLRTHKAISRWEVWPNPAGQGCAPPFEVLGRLAELYHCAVADLVADQGDFRHLDSWGAQRAALGGTARDGAR